MNNKIEDLAAAWEGPLSEFLQSFKGVAVACSGGLDSTVLLHLLLAFTKEKKNFPLAICHINFGLRANESDLDQAFLEDLARQHELQIFTHNAGGVGGSSPPPTTGVQAWARQVRYTHFAALADAGWLIALAHHQDDVAENVLLRLARGSSPGGLVGMQEWHAPYWRPLLGLAKAELAAWASRHKVPHRHDASNDKMNYSRNVIRHKVLPELEALYPGAAARIARCAWQAADYAALTRQHIAVAQHDASSTLPAVTEEEPPPPADGGLLVAALQKLPPAACWEAVAGLIGKTREGRRRLTHKFLSRVMMQLALPPTARWSLDLPAGSGQLYADAGYLRVRRPTARLGGPPTHPRAAQHRATWWAFDECLLLEEGAAVRVFYETAATGSDPLPGKAAVEARQKTRQIAISSLRAQQIRVYLPKASELLQFVGMDRAWTFKELLRRVEAPASQRPTCWAVEDLTLRRTGHPTQLVGFLLGDHLMICDDQGQMKAANVTVNCEKFNYDDSWSGLWLPSRETANN